MWLKRRARVEAVFSGTMAVGAGIAGSLLSAGTAAGGAWLFWQVWQLLLSMPAGRQFVPHISRGSFMLLWALVLVLLFVFHRRRDSESLFSFSRFGWTSGVPTPEALLMLGPMLAELVCIGPASLQSAAKLFREARRWQLMNLDVCAAVLALLLSHPRRVGLRLISREVSGFDARIILPQLLAIIGVVHLRSVPEGLSLSSALREEITGSPKRPSAKPSGSRSRRVNFACAGCGQRLRFPAFLAGNDFRCPHCGAVHQTWRDHDGEVHIGTEKSRQRARPRPKPEPEVQLADHEILGVAPTATLDEIKRAYRRLMKEHHPDRVSTHGSTEREQAEEKTKLINRAYEALKERRRANAG